MLFLDKTFCTFIPVTPLRVVEFRNSFRQTANNGLPNFI